MSYFIKTLIGFSSLVALCVNAHASAVTTVEGGATLTQYHGVWLMNLYGSREQMARQHGLLIRDRVSDTALPFFAEKIHNAIKQTYIIQDYPYLAGIAKVAVDWFVTDPLRKALPREDRAVYKAFAEGAGFSYTRALSAAVVPDVGQWLTTRIFHDRSIAKGAFPPLPGFGCSSFVVPRGSPDGFIHARNLDYESYGIFDRNPVVIYFHPDHGQSYTSVSALGIHTAGITATNESGITLDLHQLFIDAVSRHATPILATTERVVREAHTLREAVEILKASKFASPWAIVLSSARERRAAVVEVSSAGISIREMSGDHNFYHNTLSRYAYLEKTVGAAARVRAVDAQAAIDAISAPETAKMNNIQSVVFVPEGKLLYVATAPLPFGRPLEGAYVALPLDGNLDDLTDQELVRSNPYSEDARKAHALWRQASQIATEEGRYVEAAELLLEASKLQPEDSSYPLLAGLSYLRAAPLARDDSGKMQRLGLGDELLFEARRLGLSPYQQSVVQLFDARYHDILKKRDLARAEYAKVSEKLSKPLADARKEGLSSRFHLKDLRKIVIDYMHADVFRF